jgi:uncharacterized protein (TIGR02996 family)
MNQEDAFLQAIREEPEDDAVRLIFADWLEERGNPRGEFIRIQCALAGMAEDDERRGGLEERAEKLLRQHEPRWIGSLSSRVKEHKFRRGFIEEITISAAAFITHAQELFNTHPIRTVHVFSLSALTDGYTESGRRRFSDFCQSPHLERVTALHLANEALSDQQLRPLTETARLTSVRLLDLTGNALTSAGVLALDAAPHLPELTALLLNRNPLDSLGVQTLAGLSLAARLTRLELDQTRLANSGARALLESPHLTRLTRLSLRGNDVSPPLQEALLARFGRSVCLL